MKELEKLNWANISVVLVETDNVQLKIEGENLNKLDEFTRELTQYFIKKIMEGNTRHIATGIVAPMIQVAKNKYLRSCSAGHSVFIDTDENVYPCHMLCNEKDFIMGNNNDGWTSEKVREHANIGKSMSKACDSCIAQKFCAMWCKGIQLLYTGNMFDVCEPRCVFQRAVVEECIKSLIKLTSDPCLTKVFWKNYKTVSERLINDGYNFKR